jgi:hypothetical protein
MGPRIVDEIALKILLARIAQTDIPNEYEDQEYMDECYRVANAYLVASERHELEKKFSQQQRPHGNTPPRNS